MSFFLMVKTTGRIAVLKRWNKEHFVWVILLALGVGAGCAIIAGLIFLVPYGGSKSLVEQFVEKKYYNEHK